MLSLNDLIAQTRTVRDKYFQFFFLLAHILVEQFLIGVQAGLTLSLASLWGHAHPLQLTLQGFATFAFRFLLLSHTQRLLLQPTAIIALPWNALTTIKLQNPACHMVKEVTVVRHSYHCAFILLQVLLQPVDALGIQMVGWLIQQKDIWFLQQQST